MEELLRIIQTEFTVSNYYTDTYGTPIFLLPSNQETKVPFHRLVKKLKTYNIIAVLRKSSELKHENKLPNHGKDEKGEQMLALKIFPKMEEGKRKGPVWNFALLIATIFTVTLTGYFWAEPYNQFGILVSFISGPWYGWYTDTTLLVVGYTVALLSIVGTHELGHYFTSRKREVEASLPFFIPGIPPIGTFGAVIVQRSPTVNKDKLFDIGLMGPVTGFVIAIFVAVLSINFSPLIYQNVLYDILQFENHLTFLISDFVINSFNNYSPTMAFVLGQYVWNSQYWFASALVPSPFIEQLILSVFIPLQSPDIAFIYVAQSLVNSGYWPMSLIGPSPFTEPLLLGFLIPLQRPEIAFGSLFVNPLYWAAWVGFLITALNLFPAGMFDGGHLLRAILSRRAHFIASIIVVIIMITVSYVYLLMALLALLSIRKAGHPGALDDVSPLTTSRKIIFIVMMFILIITIPPLGWGFPFL